MQASTMLALLGLDNTVCSGAHSCQETGWTTTGQSVGHPLQDNNLYHLSIVSRSIVVQHVGFDVEHGSAVSACRGRKRTKK